MVSLEYIQLSQWHCTDQLDLNSIRLLSNMVMLKGFYPTR
jgi:hypothetical protein